MRLPGGKQWHGRVHYGAYLAGQGQEEQKQILGGASPWAHDSVCRLPPFSRSFFLTQGLAIGTVFPSGRAPPGGQDAENGPPGPVSQSVSQCPSLG